MTYRFKVHLLNDKGIEIADKIAWLFSKIEEDINELSPGDCREKSIALDKLEESCFFAKKSIAAQVKNQKPTKTLT